PTCSFTEGPRGLTTNASHWLRERTACVSWTACDPGLSFNPAYSSHADRPKRTVARRASMRDKVRFLTAMVGLMLSAGCAPFGAPSGSDAGRVATGPATTTPPGTVSSPPASPDAVGSATAAPKVAVTLFKNVRIFDGKAEKLTDASNVMVRGNLI